MFIRRWAVFLAVLLGFIAGCTATPQTATPLPTQAVTPTLEAATPTDSPSATPTEQDTPTPSATPTPKITHLTTPGEAPERFESQIIDPDSSMYANSRKVAAGDAFDSGMFERPFNADTMDKYSPDLDILRSGLYRRDEWIYVTTTLASVPKGKLLSGAYGVEIDIDLDGRGDVLIIAQNLGLMWSVKGVSIWRDANDDVGGVIPVMADPSKKGDGYEQMIFDSGSGFDADAAWARVDPNDFSSVQIAFKKSIIDYDKAFLWGAWAQDRIDPALFDYNDHFTLAEAGSPLPGQSQAYPLKGLANVDNTCRWGVGFEPSGDEPGVCPLKISSSSPNAEAVIRGLIWYDRNTNRYQDPGEPGFENISLDLTSGECGSEGKLIATVLTGLDGTFVLDNLQPGKYCLSVTGPIPTGVTPVTGTGPQTINLKQGSEVKVNFPYVIYSR